MGSGTSTSQSQSTSKQKSSQSTSPQAFYSPYGSSNNGTYTSPLKDLYNPAITAAGGKINDFVTGLPSKLDVNDFYNNPFYGQTKDLYEAPIRRNFQQSQDQLTNDLNARNQLGGSFEALNRRYANQDLDYNLQQADGNARTASANAYQQQFNNGLAGIQGLSNSNSALLNQIYSPVAYGNAIGGTQSFGTSNASGTQSGSNTPSFMDQYNNYINSSANAVKSVVGAA